MSYWKFAILMIVGIVLTIVICGGSSLLRNPLITAGVIMVSLIFARIYPKSNPK